MPTAKPLVSAYISAYNHEKYIEEAVRGLINQTYENMELIVLDDGSTDATYQKLLKLKPACEKRFKRVVMETHENIGLAENLNRIISLAQGKFFFGVASDDIAKPQAVEVLENFLSKNPEYVFALENGTDGIMVATVPFDDGCPLAAWCQDDEGNILWEIPKNYTLADNSSLSVTAGHNIDGALDMSYRSFNTVRDTLFILQDREIHPLLTIATGTPTGPGFPELSKEGNIFQFSTILTAHIVTQIMTMRGLGPDGGADTKYIVTDRLTREVAFRKFRNDYLAQDDVSVAFRDGYLFDYFDPVDFQEIARNALQHGRLNEASVHSLSTILGNIKDNDNYIIMLSRLK